MIFEKFQKPESMTTKIDRMYSHTHYLFSGRAASHPYPGSKENLVQGVASGVLKMDAPRGEQSARTRRLPPLSRPPRLAPIPEIPVRLKSSLSIQAREFVPGTALPTKEDTLPPPASLESSKEKSADILSPPAPSSSPSLSSSSSSELSRLGAELAHLHLLWLEMLYVLQDTSEHFITWIKRRNNLPEKIAFALQERGSVIDKFQKNRIFFSLMNKVRRGEITHLLALQYALKESLEIVKTKYTTLTAPATALLTATFKKPDPDYAQSADKFNSGNTQTKEALEAAIAVEQIKIEQVLKEIAQRNAKYQLEKQHIASYLQWDSARALIYTQQFFGITFTHPTEALSHPLITTQLIALVDAILDLQDRFSAYVLSAKTTASDAEGDIQKEITSLFNATHHKHFDLLSKTAL